MSHDVDELASSILRLKGSASAASQHDAKVLRTDADGTVWVRIAGGAPMTPVVASYAGVKPGDVVRVSISEGRATIVGNPTSPAVGQRAVSETVGPVAEAANSAMEEAGRAHKAADEAEDEARRAHRAADAAQLSADAAAGSARAANASATRANTAANDALAQLSVVEDVAGTLSWISEHGSYVAATDTSPVGGRVYFVHDVLAGDYVPIAEPDPSASPAEEGWYVLDVTDSQADYVMAHLAVTSAGLWVLPSGLGDAPAPRYASGYKVLLANDGMRLYDGAGRLVTSYGESIEFDSERPQYIGGENAYIVYYDSDDDGVPDSIRIGGSRVVVGAGSKTLSQVLEEVGQAASDASDALRYAEDVPVISLTSTNGTVFKANVGVSTTIIATIFTPAGRIEDSQTLRTRFGAGAYLEWGWRDVRTGADHVLLVTDPRISCGGFRLTVSPDDIDTQAVITCSLIY